MNKGIWLGLALVALPAAASEGEVDYRHHVMSAVGGHMQAMADILKQKVPHTAHLTLHANAMDDLAGMAGTLFPEGSDGGHALPEIWTDKEDFAKRITAFQAAAADMKTAAASG